MMSADLKRVRDGGGGGLDDPGSPASKKRAMGSATPPHFADAGDADDDGLEDWLKVVETKRKEAIYRQMLEYRRSYLSEQRRAEALEAQKRILEASVQAVEVCWTQLVSAVRDLAGAQALEVKEEAALEPKLEVRCQHGQLEKAIKSRLPVTQAMVKGFATLAGKGNIRSTPTDELHLRCQQLQAEASSLRSSEKLLQAQVGHLSQSNADLQTDLDKTRKALDRQKMAHDREKLEWADSGNPRERDNGTPGVKTNGSGAATPNGKVEEDVKPALPGPTADVQLQDTSELEKLATTRLAELETVRRQHTALQQEHDRLRIETTSPTEERLRASAFFQVYLQRLAFHQQRADEMEKQAQTKETKLDEIRQNNFAFREAVLGEARAEIDALRKQVGQKNEESARLRGQRDEFQADLTERKAKEAEKMHSLEQYEALAQSRQERIDQLSSEVRRLKGALGAQAASAGYLAFLKGEGGIDGDYVKDLEAKLETASAQLAALSADPSSDPRIEVDDLRRSIAKYERILGPAADAADDIKALGDKLEQADKDKRSLELRLSEAEAATNAVYAEIDGLSGLYEELDKKVKSKCFELKDGELKIQRLITEKAKADNRYFAAMRAKDGLDAETKTAQKTVDRQNKLLDKAQEVERNLQAQVVAQEQAITKLKTTMAELQKQSITTSSEKGALELQLQHAQKHLAEAQQIMHVRVADSASDREAKRRLEEEAEVSAKTIKKLKDRQEALVAAPSKDMSATEWQMKEERDKLLKLLRCSCCEQNFKQQVITKCMHTFCKNCLDSRVASRQRKCPACGIGFAKEDIQTLYWQ